MVAFDEMRGSSGVENPQGASNQETSNVQHGNDPTMTHTYEISPTDGWTHVQRRKDPRKGIVNRRGSHGKVG